VKYYNKYAENNPWGSQNPRFHLKETISSAQNPFKILQPRDKKIW